MSASETEDPPAAAVVPPAPDPAATRDRIPLAALRGRGRPVDLDLHWSTRPDGSDRRGLVMPAGTRYEIPLVLDRPLRLQAQVQLPPGAWRLGSERIAAVVTVTEIDDAGGRHELHTATVRPAASLASRFGVEVDCPVPETTRMLVLEVAAAFEGPEPTAAIWLEPALCDPSSPPDAPAASVRVAAAAATTNGPRLSVLTPVHDPPPAILRAAIDSVRAQSLADWELCLCDDGSRDPEVLAVLGDATAGDRRIHVVRHDHARGVSASTNAALGLARGEYIALLDHDDLLVPNALELVAAALAADPGADMLYSDEAVWDRGRVMTRIVKPGWSPENLTEHMYTTHLGVYRRALALALGGFRSAFDGGQDYDFVLRLLERSARVTHLPAQLYLWRAHAGSTAGGAAAKPSAYLTHPRALAEHLARSGVGAEVRFGIEPGVHRIVHRVDPGTRVAVVLASDEPEAAARVARSLAEQPHQGWDLVVADGSGSVAQRLARAALEVVEESYLYLLRAPVIGLTEEWLTAPLGYAMQDGIGAAGPLVLDHQGFIADAGLVFPQGIAIPLTEGVATEHAPSVAMNVSAVSEALLTSRALLRELGGLDPSLGELMLAEYCIRALDAGRRIVNVPDARVQRLDHDPVTNDPGALWRLRRGWFATRGGDPLYNPGYRPDRGDRAALIAG